MRKKRCLYIVASFDALYNSNALITTDWPDFKTELESIFEDVNKGFYLYKGLVQLCQMPSVADYTKTFCIIVLELAPILQTARPKFFQYIEHLTENLRT